MNLLLQPLLLNTFSLFQRAEAAAKRAKIAEEDDIRRAQEKKKRRYNVDAVQICYLCI